MLQNFLPLIAQQDVSAPQQPTLRMARHERMGGSVPVWSKDINSDDVPMREQIAQTFEQVLSEAGVENSSDSLLNSEEIGLRMALRAEPEADMENPSERPFGFGDLIDIINPLHHIPVVGTLYREMTGDQIHGSGRVLGAALFGGPMGAMSSLMNVVIAQETGRDLPQLALDMAMGRTHKSGDVPGTSAENATAAYRASATRPFGHLNT